MLAVKPVMIGVINTTWAITMEVTVYSSLNLPSGPLRDRINNTARPATTAAGP